MQASAITAIPMTGRNIASSRRAAPLRHRKSTELEPVGRPKVPRPRRSRRALRLRHDLSGIEDVLRIERLFQRPHRIEGLGAQFRLEIFLLALADAVLAGAGAVHRL